MIYVSMDLETTGLDPELDQILEFAAVIEDTNTKTPVEELPNFQRYIIHQRITGHPFALNMNAKILEIIAKPDHVKFSYAGLFGLQDQFIEWLSANDVKERFTPAGKNFASFDRMFLKQSCPKIFNLLSHRTIDPAILYFDPNKDEKLPDTKLCCERAGVLSGMHNALGDARMVVRVIRHYYE